MEIPDNQEVCLFWDDKPIGKIFSKNTQPYPTEEIYTIVWQGECLGEKIKATSFGEAVKKMMMIADSRNIVRTHVKTGYGIDTLYTPAFEE